MHERIGQLLSVTLVIVVGVMPALLIAPDISAIVPAQNDLVSIGFDGSQSDNHSQSASISGNGRYVAFSTNATNLVPNDTNNVYDVFVRDLVQGSTQRVSVSSLGDQSNAYSGNAKISENGRFVVFESLASNLVPNAAANVFEIYSHDMQTGSTALVSTNAADVAANQSTALPAVSADGRYVVFQSSATNLVPGVSGGQVFLKDMVTGQIKTLAINSNGQLANSGAGSASISCNGNTVVFASAASNLIGGDVNGQNDIFMVSNATANSTLTEITPGAGRPNNIPSASGEPVISCDGSAVASDSVDASLASNDTNGSNDVFRYDSATGQIQMVSVNTAGQEGSDLSDFPNVSADGRYVVFESANALDSTVGGLYNKNVFIRDTVGNTTSVISRNAQNAVGFSGNPSISSDGNYVAYDNQDSATSSAGKLSPADTNGKVDIYRSATGINVSPAAPTNLAAASPTRHPILTWDAVSGSDTYNVYRDGSKIGSSAANSYIDSTATIGAHTYYVTARNSTSESEPSNSVTVTVGTVATFTSAASLQVNARDAMDFTVTTSGSPTATITESGTLPNGLSFRDNGNGTASLSGQASTVNQGYYFLTFTATNSIGSAQQSFVLSVNNAQTTPTFLNGNSLTVQYGVLFSFTIDTTGNPIPNITKSGSLPNGIKFKDNNDGTATLSGTIKGHDTTGSSTFTLQAKSKNGIAVQSFTINW